MFWDDPYKKQVVKKVQTLIASNQFQKANDICSEVLEKDPDDSTFLKLVKEIEDAVKKANEIKIDEKMEELEILWKEGKYSEIIQELNGMKRYSEDYQPLLDQIAKAEALYREELDKNKEIQSQRIKEEFKELFKEEKFDEIMQKCQSMENSHFKDEDTERYILEIKEKLIDTQLEKKKDFISGDKYDEILRFLEDLKNIQPNYQKIKDLIEEMKLRKVNDISAEQEESSFEAVDNIKTLLKLQKYEEAYTAAQELAVYNPESKIVKELLKEAQEKFDAQIQEETIKQIEDSQKSLEEAYEENKDEYENL